MWHRYLTLILAITMLMGISGCASSSPPPPDTDDNQYINDAYQYSVAIPPGWIAHEEAPEDMAELMGADVTDATNLILVNPSGGGLIGILNLSDENDFSTYVQAPLSTWERMPRELERRMGEKGEILRFDYEFHPDYLARMLGSQKASPLTFKPEALLTAEFDMRYANGDSKSRIKWYLYPCRIQNTCQTIVMLSCNQDQYEANRSAFDAIVSSLSVHAAAGN